MAKLTARLLLVVVGVALPLLMLEIAFRVFGPIVPGNYETGVWAEGHPVVGHYHIPGASAWVREPEFTTHLRFNRFGLRGPEIAGETGATARRILLLGDSFLEAKQVSEVDALPNRLGIGLEERQAPSAEMLNAGTFDWSQVHEYLYLQHAGPSSGRTWCSSSSTSATTSATSGRARVVSFATSNGRSQRSTTTAASSFRSGVGGRPIKARCCSAG